MAKQALLSLPVVVLLLSALPARADVRAHCDLDDAGPTIDGVAGIGEYPQTYVGGGNGFGGMFGAGVDISLGAGANGALGLLMGVPVTGTCTLGADDTIVLYVDSIPGLGFADTTSFTDDADAGRAAVSAMGTGGGRADLTFAPDFTADYAIVLRGDSTSLFELRAGASHVFVRSLTRAPEATFSTSCIREVGGLTMADLGSQAGNPFRWMGTLINASNAFRSNEMQGVITPPAANIGATSYSLAAGDRNTYLTRGPIGLSGPFAWIEHGAYRGGGVSPDVSCGHLTSVSWAVAGFSDGSVPFGGDNQLGDFARSTSNGGVTTGGMYGFQVRTNDHALGVQPGSGDFAPGSFTLRLPNLRTTTLTSAAVDFEVFVRNDQGRASSMSFSYSTNGTSFTSVPAAQVVSGEAADPSPTFVSNARTASITGIVVPPGGFLYLRWTGADVSGTGSRDELALDDIVVVPTFSTCGNGTSETGEACDAGGANGSTSCGCQWTCAFGSSGTACGGGGGGVCDAPDTCDGNGACVDRFASVSTICNAADPTEPCDADDLCTGTDLSCPARLASASTVCNAADPTEPCDADDLCTGTDLSCAPRFASASTVCNAADPTEPCDSADLCTGTSLSCPARFAPASTVCNAADPTEPCDSDDLCTGTSLTCPARFASASTVCNAADPTEPCDSDDLCTGTSLSCPARFAPASTVCNAADPTLPCDADDVCNGTSLVCAPEFAVAGTNCRASTGTCDLGAACTGASASCPASAPANAGTPCRASAGLCDVAESCTGGSLGCPADLFATSGQCRASAGTCDVAESCDGSGAGCPADLTAPDGTGCADSLTCNGNETCMSGTCAMGTMLDCDDGDLCTTDGCGEPAGCSNTDIVGCCNLAADCEDSDLCTVDSCSGPGGTCTNSGITDCCTADADCADASLCTTDTCNTTTNRCEHAPVAGCCSSDGDCEDGNVCTANTCDTGSGSCSSSMIAGCCVTDGDCDDSDACTADACGATNTCTNDAITGCCTTAAECDDGDVCTTDTCSAATMRCENSGSCADGGTDAGPQEDASVPTDAGGSDGGLDGGDGGMGGVAGGCGCRVSASDRSPAWLALVGLVLFVRRRRSR